MAQILQDRSKLVPLLVVSVAIAVGATLVILLTGDETSGGSSASSEPAAKPAQSAGGTGGQATAPAGGAGAGAVEIIDFKFDPEPITVKAGTEIQWTNVDSAPHTATADDGSFDTGELAEGETGSATLDQPGEISYVCDIHPFMTGTVVVE